MLAELKREVGRLVVQTTPAVTGKILTPEDCRTARRKERETIGGMILTKREFYPQITHQMSQIF